MNRVYSFIVDRPKLLLSLIALLTLFFGFHARHIRIDSSVESLLPRNDPEKTYYAEVRRLFGSDEIGVIGLVTDNIYTPAVLHKIRRLTDEIKQIDGVENVVSVTNTPDAIIEIIPSDPQALEEIRNKLAERPMYLKNLVAADGRAATINILFADLDDDEFFRRGIDQKIEAIVARENGPEKLYYTGLPHFKVYAVQALWGDLRLFLPITLLLIVVVLFLSFHSLRGVLLPVLTVVISLIWTLGIMVLAGSHLSLGSVALPPLVLVLGTAYALHMIAEYYELAKPGRSTREIVLETMRTTTTPTLIAAFTTVLGFLSLSVNRIVSIREMGVYSSIGITIAFVLSVIFVPALLVLLRLPTRTQESFAPRVTALLQKWTLAAVRYRRTVFAIALLISAFCAWKSFSIEVDSNLQSFFREHDPIREATEAINRHLVGSMTFYVMIDGPEADSITKWDTLWRTKNLQLYIDSLPGVDKTVSFVDYCEMFDRSTQEEDGDVLVSPEGQILPSPQEQEKTTFWENPERLDSVLRLIAQDREDFSRVVNQDFSRTAIVVRTNIARATDVLAMVDKIHAFARGHLPPELTAHATGNLILHSRTIADITSGQIQSLALTAGVIFVLMSAMFLSTQVGVIAMIPNLFPILVFFGLLGATGAVLNLGTNLIASIALGIAVDDTIHIMSRLNSEVRTTPDQTQALLRTLGTVGKPALYTSLLLCFGFLVLGLSTFVPIQQFGILSAVTMVIAIVGEIMLLPALLATTRIITLWDLLHMKLGKDPQQTIRIFANLRPFQAKIAALMGDMRSFQQGQAIIRRGEEGKELFVIISGRAEIRVQSNGQTRSLAELRTGDTFGVSGFVRQQERIADVIALEDGEVLVMDERFLNRIWRYPRIAARIFFNISMVQSDRFEAQLLRAGGNQTETPIATTEGGEKRAVSSPS
jgi:predicted RND superfamily exporter protein/CRP-like cAMP-binding protein